MIKCFFCIKQIDKMHSIYFIRGTKACQAGFQRLQQRQSQVLFTTGKQ